MSLGPRVLPSANAAMATHQTVLAIAGGLEELDLDGLLNFVDACSSSGPDGVRLDGMRRLARAALALRGELAWGQAISLAGLSADEIAAIVERP